MSVMDGRRPHDGLGGLAVAVALLLVAASVGVAGASASRVASPPACRATQLRASLVPAPYSPARGFSATVWYTNTGATCSVTPDNLMYEAVSGPAHTVIGASASGAVAYQAFVLGHGRRAYAKMWITSISTPAFTQLVRTHGSACTPKMADGVLLLGLGVGWPPTYFALPEQVPVCTTDYFNVVGAVVAKKLTPSEAQRADLVAGVAEVRDMLNVWAANGPATATRTYLVAATGAIAGRLTRGTVTAWHLSAWSSPSRFTLFVSMDLHFAGSPGAWSVGDNDRFITFTRTSSATQWRLTFHTGM
jgi:hypothetical protein